MEKFLTQETPEKVLTLLATSMASLFFLFAVTFSTASFHQVQTQLPDPFNPARVMAVMDSVSNSYSGFLAENLINPASNSFASVASNAGELADNAGVQLLNLAGAQYPTASLAAAQMPQVAGMSIRAYAAPANAGSPLSANQ